MQRSTDAFYEALQYFFRKMNWAIKKERDMNKEKQTSIICILFAIVQLSKRPAINRSHNKYIINERQVPNWRKHQSIFSSFVISFVLGIFVSACNVNIVKNTRKIIYPKWKYRYRPLYINALRSRERKTPSINRSNVNSAAPKFFIIFFIEKSCSCGCLMIVSNQSQSGKGSLHYLCSLGTEYCIRSFL